MDEGYQDYFDKLEELEDIIDGAFCDGCDAFITNEEINERIVDDRKRLYCEGCLIRLEI